MCKVWMYDQLREKYMHSRTFVFENVPVTHIS